MIRVGETICGGNALHTLIELAKYVDVKNLMGDVVGVGVYKGDSALELSRIFNNNNVYLFDTFEGLPKTNEFDNYHKEGDFNDITYEDVVNLFSNNSNVSVFKGIFPQENSEVLNGKLFKFVHLDVDIYESYVNCLNFFHNKMVNGGVMVFDDYNAGSCLGAKKAIDEFVNKYELSLNFGGDGQAYIMY